VFAVVDVAAVNDRAEVTAEARRQAGLRDPMHERVVAETVLDELGDGRDLELVVGREALEIGEPRHRPVLVHHLADHARRLQPRETSEIDRALGLTGAHEHAALARSQRKDVAGADDVTRTRAVAQRREDRGRAIGSRQAGADPTARVHRERERGASGVLFSATIIGRPSSASFSSESEDRSVHARSGP